MAKTSLLSSPLSHRPAFPPATLQGILLLLLSTNFAEQKNTKRRKDFKYTLDDAFPSIIRPILPYCLRDYRVA